MAWCPKCECWMSMPENHVCPPQYEVWVPSNGEDRSDAWTCYAHSEEDAAEKYGEYYDSDGDHTLLSSRSELEVIVSQIGTTDLKAFGVTGEAVPEYSAREMELSEVELPEEVKS